MSITRVRVVRDFLRAFFIPSPSNPFPREPEPMRPAYRRLVVTLTIALCTAAVGLVRQAIAWDSRKSNPTHPTHSYLTEWAVDQLKLELPEVQVFRAQLIDGANQELHELKTSGSLYGVDLEAKREQHKGTNEGCDDIQGWWDDARNAYRAGDKKKAYFLLGIMLHMVEDMGVPAHANHVHHQGNATEFDNFEFMALSNWKPKFDAINRTDPGFAEPWKYYGESQNWTHADAPDYLNPNKFSKTWVFASAKERALLSNRQGRTCNVAMWALRAGAKAFASH
jgi:hypothetical protein